MQQLAINVPTGYDDDDARRLTYERQTFWAPSAGGYIRQRGSRELADDAQVCRGLSCRGSTLACQAEGTRGDLEDVIKGEVRREAARLRRARNRW